jgi:hypothetical protein
MSALEMGAMRMSAMRMSAMVSARRGTACGLALLTLATGMLTTAEVRTSLLLYLTVAFVLAAPGWAIACYLRITQPALLWSVASGLGIALGILVAQVMVSSGYWHPWGAMLGFEALTLAALMHHAVKR